MIRRLSASAAALAALALVPQPLAAQAPAPSSAEVDKAMAELGTMFPAEPLTAEQQARLPQAQRIIARLIPDGTLGEMMGSTYDKMLAPIVNAMGSPAAMTVTGATGFSPETLALDEARTAQIAALFDPAYEERQQRELARMPALMREVMTTIEPAMRKAMSELYAINFSQGELDDIEAFFKTDTGATYARKSFAMSSDPRVIAASMEALPQMMAVFGNFDKQMAEATAGLPARRTFAELARAEKAEVARLTGRSVAEIEAQLAEARKE